jgi:hypothetical protein
LKPQMEEVLSFKNSFPLVWYATFASGAIVQTPQVS